MNEAIKLAIEKGGYDGGYFHNPKSRKIWLEWIVKNEAAYTRDPLFWQALGKALGMPDWVEDSHYPIDSFRKDCSKCWAMKYFDITLTGGDKEKFWKELMQ